MTEPKPESAPSVPTSGPSEAPSTPTPVESVPKEEHSTQVGDVPADQLASDGDAVVKGLPEDGSSKASTDEA